MGNPTYHLNRELEHTDAYYPNQSGYSVENPIQLDYERWHSCVMAVKMAADKTGSVIVWIDGVKLCEYEDIKICANTNPSITQITMGGTIAQPAYDAPAYYRQTVVTCYNGYGGVMVQGVPAGEVQVTFELPYVIAGSGSKCVVEVAGSKRPKMKSVTIACPSR